MRKFILTTLSLALCSMLFLSCTKYSETKGIKGICKVYCDESFQNILEEEIGVFGYQYPNVTVLDKYMSESEAFDSLMANKIDLIITSTDLTPDQKKILASQDRAYRSQLIAVDAVALIVNKDCDIDELGMQELQDIFTGKYRKWGEVIPTAQRNDSIVLVFDSNKSGIIHYLRNKFLGGKVIPFDVYSAKSTEEVFSTIEKHKNAIGFVGVSWITDQMNGVKKSAEQQYNELNKDTSVTAINFTSRFKVVKVCAPDKISGVQPYQAYINDGSYPLFRKIYAIDASPLGSTDHSLFTFLTGTIGQKIILHTGIMPGAEPVRVVELQ